MSAASAKLLGQKKSSDKLIIAPGGEEYGWEKFDIKNVRFGAPENKKYPEGAPIKGTYVLMKIEYNYGTPETPAWRPLKINAPRQHSPFGVSAFKKEESEGDEGAAPSTPAKNTTAKAKMNYTLYSPIDFKNQEQERFAEIIHEIYVLLAIHFSDEVVAGSAGASPVNIPSFSYDDPPRMGNWDQFALAKRQITARRPIGSITYPLKFSKIKNTNQIDFTSPLRMSGNVSFDGDYTTKFTNCPPKGEEPINILPAIITSSKFDHVTMYNISSVFVGSKGASIQIRVATSILTSRPVPRQSSNVSHQGSTYARLQEEQTDEELREVNDYLAEMMAKSLEEAGGMPSQVETSEPSTSQSTNAPQITYVSQDNNHDTIRSLMNNNQVQYNPLPQPSSSFMPQPPIQFVASTPVATPVATPVQQYTEMPQPPVQFTPPTPVATPVQQYTEMPQPPVQQYEMPQQPPIQFVSQPTPQFNTGFTVPQTPIFQQFTSVPAAPAGQM